MGMIAFVIACIILVAGFICLISSFIASKSENRAVLRGLTVVLVVVAVIFTALGGIREVTTNAVGVPTAFGHVETALRPGLHWKAPWTRVNILDETVQTTTFEGGFDSSGNCVGGLDVRIGGQQQACADLSIQWKILDSGAPSLYRLYNKSGASIMETIQDAVVIRELKTVVNDVLGDYNPIQDVALNTGAGNSQFSTFSKVIESRMRQDLAGRVKIVNFFMPIMHYDPATQARLDRIQQQYGDTAIAIELLKTNQAQAKADAAIGQPTATQLQFLCYQIVQTAEKTGYTGLPATFSCGSGSGSVVSVGSGH